MWLHSFGKASLEKPSFGSMIRLPIEKVPQRGSTPLNPKEVSIG